LATKYVVLFSKVAASRLMAGAVAARWMSPDPAAGEISNLRISKSRLDRA
jgi:hypothetical protein